MRRREGGRGSPASKFKKINCYRGKRAKLGVRRVAEKREKSSSSLWPEKKGSHA